MSESVCYLHTVCMCISVFAFCVVCYVYWCVLCIHGRIKSHKLFDNFSLAVKECSL